MPKQPRKSPDTSSKMEQEFLDRSHKTDLDFLDCLVEEILFLITLEIRRVLYTADILEILPEVIFFFTLYFMLLAF